MNIKVEKLSFAYADKPVLKDISFEYANTNAIAIVGASGSGKSTLLRLLSGSILPNPPSKVQVNNLFPRENTAEGNIGFMFQEPTLMPNLTVEENVILPLKLSGASNIEFAYSLIDKVGLSLFKSYLPSELSGGMKTRVALARTFVTKPELILLDEPFGALDVKWKTTLYRELEDLRKEFGATLLIVTHDIQEALLLSNDILVLAHDGTLLEKIKLNSAMPRVYDDEAVFSLRDTHAKIRRLIMDN